MSESTMNLDDLFNPKVEITAPAGKNTEEYNPSAEKGKNKVYQSIIRFIPWFEDPNKSIKEKWVSWLVDPITNKGRYVDCPSSVGKPSLLQEMFFKLRKSDSVQEQKKSEIFSRRHAFASLIQVIKDTNAPELEGKILVWRYGKKVWDKINSEQNPIIGDKHEPFRILDGKLFALVVTEVSNYNNYDQSKFLDKKLALCIPDEAGKLVPVTESTDKMFIYNYLKEHSPNLNKYNFKEWDQETYDYVNHVITAVTGKVVPSNTIANLQQGSTPASQPAYKPTNQPATGITSQEISLGELDTAMPTLGALPDLSFDTQMPDMGIGGNLDDALSGL